MNSGRGASQDGATRKMAPYERKTALGLLGMILRIRRVEEEIARRYPQQEMRCPTHLCVGQEAVPAAAGMVLAPRDFAVGTHRAHGHYLAKGGDLTRMLAEIYGRDTGCARGKGGSMHLVDTGVGFMGSTAIVGGTLPVGVGLGLSIALKGGDQVSAVFFGEGATEEGVFYESLNLAALKQLPVLFICENNGYSVYTNLKQRRPEDVDLAALSQSMGVRARKGDGNDAWEAYTLVKEAVAHARAGRGPTLLLFDTYRWYEHCGPYFDDDLGYRSRDEVDQWMARDPLARMEALVLDQGFARGADLRSMAAEVQAEIDRAFERALAAPVPRADQVTQGLFSEKRRRPWDK